MHSVVNADQYRQAARTPALPDTAAAPARADLGAQNHHGSIQEQNARLGQVFHTGLVHEQAERARQEVIFDHYSGD